jgi:hypothetical protein
MVFLYIDSHPKRTGLWMSSREVGGDLTPPANHVATRDRTFPAKYRFEALVTPQKDFQLEFLPYFDGFSTLKLRPFR